MSHYQRTQEFWSKSSPSLQETLRISTVELKDTRRKLIFSRRPVMSDACKPGLGKQQQMGLCEFEARVSQTNKSTTKCLLHKQKHQLWVGWRCSLVGRALALIHIGLQYCTHRAERSVCTISALGGVGRTPASLRPIWSTL